jgi:hypothetical protein
LEININFFHRKDKIVEMTNFNFISANELFVIDLVSDRSWSSLSFWFPLGERSGCLESAMLATERKGDLPIVALGTYYYEW